MEQNEQASSTDAINFLKQDGLVDNNEAQNQVNAPAPNQVGEDGEPVIPEGGQAAPQNEAPQTPPPGS